MYIQQLIAEKLDSGQVEMRTIEDIQRQQYQRKMNKYKFFKLFSQYGLGILAVIYLFLIIAVSFLAVYKNHELSEIQEVVNDLKKDVDYLRYHCFHDLMHEIREFERQSYIDITHPKMHLGQADYSSVHDDSEIEYGKIEYTDNDNEDKYRRNKREVLASTRDGVPIISESYVARKRLNTPSSREKLMLYDTLEENKSSHVKSVTQRSFVRPTHRSRTTVSDRSRNGQDVDVLPTAILSRTSRVMKTDQDKHKDFRRIVRKSARSAGGRSQENKNLQEQVESMGTKVYRERNLRHKRYTPAFHLNGNSSRQHGQQHYEGNGRMRHPHGFVDWSPAEWVNTLGFDQHFDYKHGHLTIKESGLYFIYAQIFYSDVQDMNGYKIMKTHPSRNHISEMISQCTVTVPSGSREDKANTCFTATLEYLQENDILKLHDIGNNRISVFEPGKSFFGIIKMSDFKLK